MTDITPRASAPSVFSFESTNVRTFADDHGEPWFLANDVCAVLGYKNPRMSVDRHCRSGGVTKRDTPTEAPRGRRCRPELERGAEADCHQRQRDRHGDAAGHRQRGHQAPDAAHSIDQQRFPLTERCMTTAAPAPPASRRAGAATRLAARRTGGGYKHRRRQESCARAPTLPRRPGIPLQPAAFGPIAADHAAPNASPAAARVRARAASPGTATHPRIAPCGAAPHSAHARIAARVDLLDSKAEHQSPQGIRGDPANGRFGRVAASLFAPTVGRPTLPPRAPATIRVASSAHRARLASRTG